MGRTAGVTSDTVPTVVIRPSHGWISLQLRAVWEYRELLYFLVWRDLKVRYKQTVVGVAWVILQPLVMMTMMTIVFGKLARIEVPGLPYPIYLFSALVPWQLFSQALSVSGNCLVGNQQLLTKIYLPRLIIPIAAVLVGLVDFWFSFAVLLGLMFYYRISLHLTILVVPCLALLAVVTALAMGLWLSALNVRYRDVGHMVPLMTQMLMYASPIIYPAERVPEAWRALYCLNPLVCVLEGFRWALLGRPSPLGAQVVLSGMVTAVLLVGGLYYFRRMEKTFADIV